jgi:RNA polymerase sigma-70 factor, ECF subfamily
MTALAARSAPGSLPAWHPGGDADGYRAAVTAGAAHEAELVARARAGDRGAFEELVRLHADRLYAVVLRVSGHRHEAEEVVQETFLRAWRNIGRFEGRSQFFTWLYRIGVNEARRSQERRRTRPQSAPLADAAIQVPDEREAPEARAEAHELRRALEAAILALPLDYRMPLVLRDVEGLSTAQAAAVMDLGEAAFKSRLHRARLAVRSAVDDLVPKEKEHR